MGRRRHICWVKSGCTWQAETTLGGGLGLPKVWYHPCKITHGIPWNVVEIFLWDSVWHWDMEFHGNISMVFYGVPQKLNRMEFCLVLGHGIPWNLTKTFFMEFYGVPQKLNAMRFCLVLGPQSP